MPFPILKNSKRKTFRFSKWSILIWTANGMIWEEFSYFFCFNRTWVLDKKLNFELENPRQGFCFFFEWEFVGQGKRINGVGLRHPLWFCAVQYPQNHQKVPFHQFLFFETKPEKKKRNFKSFPLFEFSKINFYQDKSYYVEEEKEILY